MTQLEMVQAFLRALGEGDLDTAARFCQLDFVAQAPGGQMLGWTDLSRAVWGLKSAMPDLRYELTAARDIPGFVTGLLATSGTFRHDLDLQIAGTPVLPASGVRVIVPPEPFEVAFMSGAIRRIGWPSSAAGARGLLAAAHELGASLAPAGIMG